MKLDLKVTDLAPGDRVILNCPTGRTGAHRQAQFEGIYSTHAEAKASLEERGRVKVTDEPTAEFLASGRWASFRVPSSADRITVMALLVQPDGSLRDMDGRAIYVERRLPRPAAG